MRLFPAIDLKDGNCVRLYQGDYNQQTIYGDDPVAQASAFVEEGATVLHLVDLDAAKTGDPVNREVIARVCDAVSVPVQVGGGVRSVEAAEALFERGVERVVIGTAAIEQPELVAALTESGRAVVVGLDTRDGYAATHGWTESTGIAAADVVQRFVGMGVSGFVVTDIGRDGTQSGPDISGLSGLLSQTAVPIIASGGVGTLAHLETLAQVRVSAADGGQRLLEGVIVGKALYERSFTVGQAISALGASGSGQSHKEGAP